MEFNPKKFLSRKFLVSIVGIIVGIAIAFGAEASEIMQIAGAITSAVSAVSYIFGEAIIDAAAAKQDIVMEALPIIEEEKED